MCPSKKMYLFNRTIFDIKSFQVEIFTIICYHLSIFKGFQILKKRNKIFYLNIKLWNASLIRRAIFKRNTINLYSELLHIELKKYSVFHRLRYAKFPYCGSFFKLKSIFAAVPDASKKWSLIQKWSKLTQKFLPWSKSVKLNVESTFFSLLQGISTGWLVRVQPSQYPARGTRARGQHSAPRPNRDDPLTNQSGMDQQFLHANYM
jgi:hypothetical protein